MESRFVNFTDPSQLGEDVQTLPADAPLQDKVIAVLRHVYDPELPVNIYDLGLIYKLDIQDHDVEVVMTLTTPHCPVAESMPRQVEAAIKAIDDIGKVCVRLTWDPPWTAENLSDEARLALGIL